MTEETNESMNQEPESDSRATAETEDIDTLRQRLDEEKTRAEGYLANWQRAAADFQNYKRRVEQERQEVARLSNASLIINLLPILDDLERALSSLDVRLVGLTWFDGIRLILRKFQFVLENAGVQEIAAEGEVFDPRWHEAITSGEGEEGRVIAQVQKGYKLGDRVLRPAMVIVGKGKEEGEAKPDEGKSDQGS